MTTYSRRAFLGSTAGIGLGAIFAVPVGAQTGMPQATPATPAVAGGEWNFTDDMGMTVTLPTTPTRLFLDLASAAPLWDFGIKPLAVSGWTVATDAAWGNVDRSIADITNSADAGVPNTEELIALDPELYVTQTYLPEDAESEGAYWGFTDVESFELINSIVPVIAISAVGLADKNVERYAELAGALGADLTVPELAAAKTAYDEALAALDTVAAEKSDLTIAFMSAKEDVLHFASPQDWAELSMYTAHGLNLAQPDVELGMFWEELSLEQAALYPADVIFQSNRSIARTIEDFTSHPTLGQLPAVKAGQISTWNQDFISSYQGLTASITHITEVISTATRVS